MKEEKYSNDSKATNRQIEVETPSPCPKRVSAGKQRINLHLIGKSAANNRAKHRCNPKSHTEKGCKDRSFANRDEWKGDHHTARVDAGRTHTGNGTSNYEGNGAWSGAAEGRSDLEDHNRNEENPFCQVKLVDAASNGSETGCS